jgi:hypothetical protein
MQTTVVTFESAALGPHAVAATLRALVRTQTQVMRDSGDL